MTEVDRLAVIERWECPRCGRARHQLDNGRYCRGVHIVGQHDLTEWQRVEYVRADTHQGAVDRVAVLESAVRGLLGAGPSWPVPDTREAILAARHGVQS